MGNVTATEAHEARPKTFPMQSQMKPRENHHPVAACDVDLADELALLPDDAENAGKQPVRDGKAADHGNDKRNYQADIDNGKNDAQSIPSSIRKRREPPAIPYEVKDYEQGQRDADRFMGFSRQQPECHQIEQQPKQHDVQKYPFHVVHILEVLSGIARPA